MSKSGDDNIPSLLTWAGIKSIWPIVLILTLIGAGLAISVGKNFRRALLQNRGWSAREKITHIDTALTGLAADAGTDLANLFVSAAFSASLHDRMIRKEINVFEASVEMYTVTLTALLRHGKNAPEILARSPETADLSTVLNDEYTLRLGSGYVDVPEQDRWGSPYRLFVGPWPEAWGPNLFRIRRSANLTPDTLTVSVSSKGGEVPAGLPAPTDLPVYVWSYGLNGVSDQALYDPTHQYARPARQHYRADASERYLGGGDDISNWDRDESWNAFYTRR